MITTLRRFRWLAAFLLVASPAMGGQLIAVLHPCPAKAAVAGVMPAAGHQHGHAPTAPGHSHDPTQHCNCVGTGQVATIGGAPAPTEIAVAPLVLLRPASWRRVESRVIASALLDRLPHQTAPPLA
ncbi:MAG: hypothetical protein ABJC19_07060 [Gemmatimonadota bacterium]